MEIVEGVILTSWNYIIGPHLECLWLSSYHPVFHLTEITSQVQKAPFIPQEKCMLNSEKVYVDNKTLENDNELVNDIVSDISSSSYTPKTYSSSHLSSLSSNDSYYKKLSKEKIIQVENALKMSGQLLIGETESISPFAENTSRLFFSEDKELILVSVVFRKRPWPEFNSTRENENVCLCLATVFRYENFQFIHDVKHVIDVQLRNAADIIQNTDGSPYLAQKEVSTIIEGLLSTLKSLHLNTVKCIQNPLWAPFKSKEKLKFTSRAIASHLQSCGYSVVTGDSEYLVNQMVYTLTTFSSDKEKTCSRKVQAEASRSYQSGIYVQGLLKDSSGQSDMVFQDLVQNANPVTIIDTTWNKVRQIITPVASGIEDNRNSLHTVTKNGKLIPDLLHDLSLFERQDCDNEKHVKMFTRYLKIKAVSLLKIIEKFRALSLPVSTEQLMTMLGVSEVADLQIILGYAEKLKPGIRCVIEVKE